MSDWRRKVEDGFDIFVRTSPNASRDALGGVWTDPNGQSYLEIRVRAVPEKGKANAAVEKLLAKVLGLPKSTVHVRRGDTQRLKIVRISCEGAMAQKLEQLGEGGE